MSVYSRLVLWFVQESRIPSLWSCELNASHVRAVAIKTQLCCSRQRSLWTVGSYRKLTSVSAQPVRGAKGKVSADKSKNTVPTDTPTQPLVPSDPTICSGVNITKDGTDPPIKPDSEYPDWLWGLLETAEKPQSYTELPPTSKVYWRRYNKQKARERNMLQKQLGRS